MTRERLVECINKKVRAVGAWWGSGEAADLILSELAKERPTAHAGLVEELRAIMTMDMLSPFAKELRVKEILSRYEEAEEPLAVIADRKGVYITIQGPDYNKSAWFVVLRGADHSEFRGKTYEQAESLAREYLEKMEDVKK